MLSSLNALHAAPDRRREDARRRSSLVGLVTVPCGGSFFIASRAGQLAAERWRVEHHAVAGVALTRDLRINAHRSRWLPINPVIMCTASDYIAY